MSCAPAVSLSSFCGIGRQLLRPVDEWIRAPIGGGVGCGLERPVEPWRYGIERMRRFVWTRAAAARPLCGGDAASAQVGRRRNRGSRQEMRNELIKVRIFLVFSFWKINIYIIQPADLKLRVGRAGDVQLLSCVRVPTSQNLLPRLFSLQVSYIPYVSKIGFLSL